jgi:hypothetical protein
MAVQKKTGVAGWCNLNVWGSYVHVVSFLELLFCGLFTMNIDEKDRRNIYWK